MSETTVPTPAPEPQRHHFICENSRDSTPWCEWCGVFYRPERLHDLCPTPDPEEVRL